MNQSKGLRVHCLTYEPQSSLVSDGYNSDNNWIISLTCIPEESACIGCDNSGGGVIEAISTIVASIRNNPWRMQISYLRFSYVDIADVVY